MVKSSTSARPLVPANYYCQVRHCERPTIGDYHTMMGLLRVQYVQCLPDLVYTDGNAFSLWRSGGLEGSIVSLIGECRTCHAAQSSRGTQTGRATLSH